jgi:hypothetical protein
MTARQFCVCLPLMTAMVIGCSTERRSYQVAVQNKLDKPITFWLTKEHGPMEEGWLSPEQEAMRTDPPPEEKLPKVVVPAGRTAVTPKPIEGDFDRDRGRAILRVYSGTPTLTETLAIGHGSLSRVDVPLEPGANHIVIQDLNGTMKGATQNDAVPPAAGSQPSSASPSSSSSSIDSTK